MKKLLFTIALIVSSTVVFTQSIGELVKHSGTSVDYPGQNQVIIFDSTSVDVQASGLSYIYTHKLFKVLTQKGATDLNVITYGYDPLSAYVDIKEVTIYRNNGDVENIDITGVLDYPAPARMIYWGAREKMIEVGRLEPGDAVEISLFKKGYTYALLFEEDDKYIPPMRGHYYDIVPFWSSIPILVKYYSVSIPSDKTVQYRFYNGEAESSATLVGNNMVYTFVKKDIMPVDREPSMVSWSDVAPKLLISTSPNWQAKSLWFYGVNEDYGSFKSTPEIDKKVAEILVGAKTEMDSISLLTHWAADEIRYSGISMGTGEGYTLHSGEMNFADRCGVCKDKAGMLITMLRAAGFESYPAMTMAGSRIDYIPADQFNHSVTIVKLKNGEFKILDPTWVPFLRELWSSAEQQQNYLMGVPEGADLMITPVSDPKNHFVKINGESEILENGTLNGKLTISAEGQTDASIRRMFTSNFKSEWYKAVETEILRVAPQAVVNSIEFGHPYKYQQSNINITVSYSVPNFATVTKDEIIFNPIIASDFLNRAMSHMYMSTKIETRNYAFHDRCSRFVDLSETVTLPANGKLVTYNFDEDFGDDVASFKGKTEISGNQFSYSEQVSLSKRIYDANDWPSFKKAVLMQKKFADTPVIIKIH